MKYLSLAILLIMFFIRVACADELSESPMAQKYFKEAMKNYDSQQFNAAMMNFQLVVEMFPDYAKAHYYLANCYARLQRASEAVKEYRISYKLSDGKGSIAANSKEALMNYGKSSGEASDKTTLKSSLSYSSGEGVTNKYDPYLVPDHVSKLKAMKAITSQATGVIDTNNQNMQNDISSIQQQARWGNEDLMAQSSMAQIAAMGMNAAMGGGVMGGMGMMGGGMGMMGGGMGMMGGGMGMMGGGMGMMGGGMGMMGGNFSNGGSMFGYGAGNGMSGLMGTQAATAAMGMMNQYGMMRNYNHAATQINSVRKYYNARNTAIREDVNGLRTQFKRGPLYDGVQLSPSGTNLYVQYFGASPTNRKLVEQDDDEDF